MSSTHPTLAGRTTPPGTRRLRVVGGGMVAHRLVEALRDRDADGTWAIDLHCEEAHPPYDRVALTSYFSGSRPADLLLGDGGFGADPLVTVHLGSRVTALDTAARTITVDGRDEPYDAVVLATGSSAFVPPVSGADLPGAFVYRTLEDVRALEAWVQGGVSRLASLAPQPPMRGVVVGGGLLGLEAAGALHGMGVHTTVVEFA